MTAKHFIHDPTELVSSALRSIPITNPSVALDAENKTIYRRPGHDPQVSLISGGGSGHEPSFAGFVGKGLLAAAVAGTIFASPSAEQVRNAILQRVDRERGILVVVMNYTGDVLNFGMAVEKAKASGIDVEMVIVGDDVGVGRSQGGKVGRRGIAGTVLVQKMAGALAAKGASLEEVHKTAVLVSDNIVSVGASLDHVHVPGHPPPDPKSAETLAAEEVEIGMGIHNEPGSQRVKANLPDLVGSMLAQLLDQSDKDRAFLEISTKDFVVLLINNLGGVSPLELGGITSEVIRRLTESYKIEPRVVLSGTYMTSLNGPGFSITLLKLVDTKLGPGKSMLELLDAPAEATGWSGAIRLDSWERKSTATREETAAAAEEIRPSTLKIDNTRAKKALKSGLDQLIAAEPDLTKYDTEVGDGDCGIGLKRGAEAITEMLNQNDSFDDAVVTTALVAQVVERTMDGTSGALYAIFLNSLAQSLRSVAPSRAADASPKFWSQALKLSLKALTKYTPAKVGDRTLMDALYPFVETLEQSEDVKKAAAAATEGTKNTKGMKASLGRTVYVGGDSWQEVPDPGAHGLSVFLEGLAAGL
ncbi:MAG: hypothetical protein M1833_003775 [Piccolia ochrophora]|nr:MAG: hypothetical protein M1833_003775 [Piccolia ochrophora]